MGGHKQKFEVTIGKADVAAYFKSLGEGLAGGKLTMGEQVVDLAGAEGCKLSLKTRGDAYLLKVKVKFPKYGAMPGQPAGEPADAEGE